MYNIKGPSKMVAKSARRGISQNVDNFKHCKSLDNNDNELTNVSKPVFHNTCKRNILNQQEHSMQITPQHEEIINYIQDSWTLVRSDLDETCSKKSNNNCDGNCTVFFYEDDPCPHLQDFKPFDLENWWGQRLFHSITNSINGKVDKT